MRNVYWMSWGYINTRIYKISYRLCNILCTFIMVDYKNNLKNPNVKKQWTRPVSYTETSSGLAGRDSWLQQADFSSPSARDISIGVPFWDKFSIFDADICHSPRRKFRPRKTRHWRGNPTRETSARLVALAHNELHHQRIIIIIFFFLNSYNVNVNYISPLKRLLNILMLTILPIKWITNSCVSIE